MNLTSIEYKFRMTARLASIQGFVYLITGLWPFIHMESFLDVTGPKTDLWLVNTVGTLVTVIGLVLLAAAKRAEFSLSLKLLGLLSAATLMGIDVYYVTTGVISDVYLWDALFELPIAIGWVVGILEPIARPKDRSK